MSSTTRPPGRRAVADAQTARCRRPPAISPRDQSTPPRSVQSHLRIAQNHRPCRALRDTAWPRLLVAGVPGAAWSSSLGLLDEPDEVLKGLRLPPPRTRGRVSSARPARAHWTSAKRPAFDLEDPDHMLTTQPLHIHHEYRALMDEMIQTYRRGCASRIDYADRPQRLLIPRYLTIWSGAKKLSNSLYFIPSSN